LLYREKDKVKTDYIKCNAHELKDLEYKIKKRKKYLKLLREIDKKSLTLINLINIIITTKIFLTIYELTGCQ